jgi:hypothetical protein
MTLRTIASEVNIHLIVKARRHSQSAAVELYEALAGSQPEPVNANNLDLGGGQAA